MHGNFTVVFDACVLYPALLRNVLLQLATTELFRARWTEAIHDEWMRSLQVDKPDISHDKISSLRQAINDSVPDCIVTGYEFWSRLFHNMRASCATDWAEALPAHVVAKWLGHSPLVAAKHYLQTRGAHFEVAIGGMRRVGEAEVQGAPIRATA